MRRDHILAIWIGGFVLAVALYAVGPDRFIDACWNLIDSIDLFFRDIAAKLGQQTYHVVRAVAIAIFVVFSILCVLSAQRGRGGFWPFIIVAIVFMGLTWHPFGVYPAPLSRWLVAFAIVVIGAATMTRRLILPSFDRASNLPPYPPGPRP